MCDPFRWFCQLSLSSLSCIPILYSLKIYCMFLRGITLFSVAKMGYYIGGAQIFFFFLVWVSLIYNVVFVSGVQQSESAHSLTQVRWCPLHSGHVKFQGCWLLSDHSFWLLHKMRWQWFQFVWLQREGRQCLSPMSLGQFLWNWAFPKEQCDSQAERESHISPSLGELRKVWLFSFPYTCLSLSLSSLTALLR